MVQTDRVIPDERLSPKPRVSVAMCTYNGASFLGEQLASIATQDRLPDEMVVCDDGSSDQTVAELEAFAKSSPFIVRLIRNERNLGTTKNFEKAISLCKGEIIALSDQDDIWTKSRLQKTEEVFAARPHVGLVFGDAEVIDSGSAATGLRLWKSENFTEKEQSLFGRGQATAVLLRHTVVTGATMAFRSEYRKFVLPIPEIWVHDSWIALMISFFAEIVALPDMLIRYRQHANQQIGPSDHNIFSRTGITKMTSRQQFEQWARRLEEAQNRLQQYAATDEQRSIVKRLCGQASHLSARGCMPQSRWKRIPFILRELAALRYSVYSRGLMSAVRDFVA